MRATMRAAEHGADAPAPLADASVHPNRSLEDPHWDPRWDLPAVTAPATAPVPKGVVWHQVLHWSHDHRLLVRRTAAAIFAAWMVAAGVALLVLDPASEPSQNREARPAAAVDPSLVRVATATLPLVDVFANPTDPRASMTLEHPRPSGAPLTFVIEADWEGWYRVQVPAPPAGTTGWVRANAVNLSEHRVRVTVDLSDRLLTVTDAGETVLRAPIAVGLHDRPEPGATFVTETVALSNPRTAYGTHAFPLAGYGNGEETYFRGSGLVAIHGLLDPLAVGQAVEEGSIGLANADVKRLYDLLVAGTPVEILSDPPPEG